MISFSGIDLILEQPVSSDALRRAISKTLLIPTHRVSVIYNTEDYPERDAAEMVCLVSTTDGDFQQLVSLQCEPRMLPFRNESELACCLLVELGVCALIPADSIDPYDMYLVNGNTVSRVSLDATAFDCGKYIISK